MNNHPLNVLLVEDDRDMAESIHDYLALEDIHCDHAWNGASGLQLARHNAYDLLLLDINLPRLNGLQVCQALRQQGVETPILMLTARDTLEDRLEGFRVGTDDYLIKPFAMAELVARARTLARRRKAFQKILQVADLVMDLEKRQLTRGGHTVTLTPIEWDLLELLMRFSPQVQSRQNILDTLWPDDAPGTDSLKVHLYRLRKKIDRPGCQPLIHTITGHGIVIRDGEAET